MTTTTISAAARMRLAHEMTRKTLRRFPEADYRVTFSAALRIVWREAGRSAAEIWASYSGEEQQRYLERMAWYEYGRRDARMLKDGTPLPNAFTWVRDPADDLRDVWTEAWIAVQRMVLDPRHEQKDLGRIVSAAIVRSAEKINRQQIRNGSALRTEASEDGEKIREYIIDNAAPLAERAAGPEAALIIRDAIERACADDLDRRIIRLLAEQYSQRRIAELVGLSNVAIHKRIKRLRERYAAE